MTGRMMYFCCKTCKLFYVDNNEEVKCDKSSCSTTCTTTECGTKTGDSKTITEPAKKTA